MPIKIFSSDTFNGAENLILEQIKKDYGKANQIVIAPDRFALSFEMKVLQKLGKEAVFGLQVVSFTRLARKFDKNADKCLSAEAGVMLMQKVVAENAHLLSSLLKSARNPSFASDVYAVLTQLRNSNISVAKLRSTLEDLDESVVGKTKDICLLYEKFLEQLYVEYADSVTIIESFCDKMADNDFIAKSNIYVVEFYDLKGMYYEVIKRLALNAQSVSIALVEKFEGQNKRIFPSKIKQRLQNMADEAGISTQYTRGEEIMFEEKKHILSNMFSYAKVEVVKQNDFKTSLFVASSIVQEAEFVARKIKSLVVEDGLRYRDIAIMCGELESAQEIYKKVFERYQIPCFIDIRRSLKSQACVLLIKNAMQVVLKNFRQKEVITYLKQSAGGLCFEDKCFFENYCLKYNIDFNAFVKPLYRGSADEVARAEKIRGAFIAPLIAISQIKGGYVDYSNGLKNFLSLVNFDTYIDGLIKTQLDLGCREDAELCRVALEKIQSVFMQIEVIFKDKECDLENFYSAFVSAIDSFKIALTPLYLDCVFLGGAEESRFDNVKKLFITGASEGAVPRQSDYTGILGQKECVALAKCNVEIEPDAKEQALLDKFNITQILLRPQELFVSYYAKSERGETKLASSVVKQLQSFFGLEILQIADIIASNNEEDFYIKMLASELNAKKMLAEDEGRRKSYDYEKDLPELAKVFDALREVYTLKGEESESDNEILKDAHKFVWRERGGKKYSSISKIERYFRCPYMQFLESVCKVKEREECKLSVLDKGNIFHELLELFFKRCDYLKMSEEEIQSSTISIFNEILSKGEYAFVSGDEDSEFLIDSIKDDCCFMTKRLCEAMKKSELYPYKLEAGFGAGGEFSEIEISTLDGEKIYLTGKIDRIDKLDDGVVIIDYKSKGSISFGWREIFYGERIQLFTYLNALLATKKYKPLGVVYLPLSINYKKDDSKRFSYEGFVCDDKEMLARMDKNINLAESTAVGKMFPVKINVASNKISGMKAISDEDFEGTTQYVRKLTAGALTEMARGFIKPKPAKDACKYCKYINICKAEKDSIGERKFTLIKEENVLRSKDGL